MTAPTTFRLDLPWERPPLRSNGSHGNYHAKARIVKDIRLTVMLLAKNAKIPVGQHLTVQLHYAPGARTRMDSHNLHLADDIELDHLCHTRDVSCVRGPSCAHRRCINPDHLEPVTRDENQRRARANGIGRRAVA